MFFNGNTYTDFHELNLDYWIKLIKEIQKELSEIDISGMKEDIAANAAAINIIQGNIETLDNEITNLQNSFDDLSEATQKFFADVAEALSAMEIAFKAYSDAGDNSVKVWCLSLLQTYTEALEGQIDELRQMVKDLPDSFYTYNEYSGYMDPISEVLRQQARATNSIHGLTVAQYESLGITVSEYAAKLLTTLEYLVKGEILLPNENPEKWIFNPITGAKNTLAQLLAFIFVLWYSNAQSVDDYYALALTVSDYDNLNLSVYDYFANGIVLP